MTARERPGHPHSSHSRSRSRPRPHPQIALAAGLWWTAFAAISFYWAAGGTGGLATLGSGIESLAAEGASWFVTVVAITGVLKLVPVVLVLSLVQPWGDRLPQRGRLLAVGAIGVLSLLYGTVNLLQKGLVLAGVVSVAELDTVGFWGHLLVWDPVWVIGGVLLCVTAWTAREGRAPKAGR